MDRNAFWWFLSSGFLVYILGLVIERLKLSKKRTAAIIAAIAGIVLCAGCLLMFKSAGSLLISDQVVRFLVLPIGFSYYIFQAISYLADIISGTICVQRDPVQFLLYLGFFPKFISGPVEKPGALMKQFQSLENVRLFEGERVSESMAALLYGLFMKTVIADRLAIHTKVLLDNPQNYGSLWLALGMIMYTFQIYCDFAGYTSVAIGCARLFGIELSENFHAPYRSRNISVFWRRWHITLSGWLKDYIYIPLGGSRKGDIRRCLNVMIVFLVCGIWHGSGLHFLAWGLMHGLYSVIHILWEKHRKPLPVFLAYPITFFAVAAAWIMFGVSSFGTGIEYLCRMFTAWNGGWPAAEQIRTLELGPVDALLPLYLIMIMIFDREYERKDQPFDKRIFSYPPACRYLLYYLLIVAIFLLGVYGPSYNAADFMYMRF
ncbi:MAG: hypothetical protein K6B72_11350 [Lachnospiraceae bacterium]|nr:hypothetical protein [Lachnospiraceae bacterium]